VIGYISAGTVQQKRIWIASYQLPVYWLYEITCPAPDIVVTNTPDSLRYFFGGGAYIPISAGAAGYFANSSTCLDCTLLGGSNQKPSIWPN
jgi:hypothetical protein